MNCEQITISVVIPTVDRLQSLLRTVSSIMSQSFLPLEIIIIDASKEKLKASAIPDYDSGIIKIIHSNVRSVCVQRNIGINSALGKYVFLCDDDIEVSNTYLSDISHFVTKNPYEVIATGQVLEKDAQGEWSYRIRNIKVLTFLWSCFFLQSIWIDVSSKERGQSLIKGIVKIYRRLRLNDISLAGWPLMSVSQKRDVTKCTIAGLGASVIRTDWLKMHLYDEVLDPHGIGDNYGVAIQLEKHQKINILEKAFVYHHKVEENRLSPELAYYRRTLALHYFMVTLNRFSWHHLLFYKWSIFGKTLESLLKGNLKLFKYNLKILFETTFKQNPYLSSKNIGEICCTPT